MAICAEWGSCHQWWETSSGAVEACGGVGHGAVCGGVGHAACDRGLMGRLWGKVVSLSWYGGRGARINSTAAPTGFPPGLPDSSPPRWLRNKLITSPLCIWGAFLS